MSDTNNEINASENSFDEKDEKLIQLEKEEETWLEEKNVKELAKLRKQYELEEHRKNEKEARFKRLMHLLEKSKFYAKFLEARVENNKNNKKKNETSSETKTYEQVRKKQKLDLDAESSLIDKEENVKKEVDESNETYVNSMGITVSQQQPRLLEGAALRDYQIQGFTWLKLLYETGMNGILADEMGLGKTIQVIALISHLYEARVIGPYLIVAPLSTLPNWMNEFNTFAPQLPVIFYHGDKNERKQIQKEIFKKTNLLNVKCFPIVVTSYELPIRERFLSTLKWKYVIVDEGHRLKNYKSLLSRTLTEYNAINRLLLTGTPLQNNLTELWSLLHFLLPEIFNTLEVFQSWFLVDDIQSSQDDQIINKHDKIISVLHEILTPFLLRREKKDINLILPKKKEVFVYCPLTEIQLKLYTATVDKSIAKIHGEDHFDESNLVIPANPDGSKVMRYSKLRKINNSNNFIKTETVQNDIVMINDGIDQYMFSVKMTVPHVMLIKIVNHPYLVQRPVLPGSTIMRIDENLVSSSGKMKMLDGLLERLHKNGHKVLLFSTMTLLLDIIEEFIEMRGYYYERLDGNFKIKDRQQSIKRFNEDENIFIFLISTRAGGLGINLTAADTVIIFNSDWNPQVDLQAQDRCHRIGQTKPVVVYRFVSAGTIDERIVDRASAKRKLEKIIIQGGRFKNLPGMKEACNLEELKKLLNKKQQSMEIHSNGSVLTDQQWSKLLDRSDILAQA